MASVYIRMSAAYSTGRDDLFPGADAGDPRAAGVALPGAPPARGHD